MRDGDGSAFGYLFLEDGYDAAVAAEHIAEASGDELCGLLLLAKRLTVDFADAFGASHHVGGVDGLVC